jgi:radical SAM protein with 4Fe4S-binding SPASM domain
MIETIIWLITGKCNYNCKYCYALRFKKLPELDTLTCIRIIKEASKLGVKHIAFTGGEPFIRKDIFTLVEECCKSGVKASITTNGALVDEKLASRIRDIGLILYISIDGMEKEHEIIRGNGTWDILKKFLNIVNKFKIEFATITTLSKPNYKNIKALIKFFKDIGSKFSCFLPLMPFGKATWKDVLSKEEILYTLHLLNEGGLEYKHPVNIWCMPFAKKIISSPYVRVEGCRKKRVIDINVNGDILLCDVLDIVITNVRSKSLEEVIKETENHILMKQILFPKLHNKCLECPIKKKCLGGCYARAFKRTGNLNFPDPLCPWFLSSYEPPDI